MKKIGSGYNLVEIILYLFISLFILHLYFLHYQSILCIIFFIPVLIVVFFYIKTTTIFIYGDYIVVKSFIWKKTKYPINEIQSIGNVIFPICFIKFENSEKIWFQIPYWRLLSSILESDFNYVDELKELLDINKLEKN